MSVLRNLLFFSATMTRHRVRKNAKLFFTFCLGFSLLWFWYHPILWEVKRDNHRSLQTSEKEFVRRKERVHKVCSSLQPVTGYVRGVLTDQETGVIYCVVPKAGCTFWKRVFKMATSKKNVTRESVFALSRNEIHRSRNGLVRFNSSHNWTTYPTRFIVTRDPYSRLLSAYLDKVYLPDFWSPEVVPLLQKKVKQKTFKSSPDSDFLRQHFNQMASRLQNLGSSPTSAETKCGKYVTFAEFLDIGLFRREPHWTPIHEICNPCTFNVTHVVHMETFTEDARAILSKMQLVDILNDFDDITQINEELKTIIDYNFVRVFHDNLNAFYKQCITARELAYRLWNNFIWRGYIDPHINYSIPDFDEPETVKENLLDQVQRARESGLKRPDKMRAAKKNFRRDAYMSISKTMFDKISNKYATDFRLFGYDNIRDKLRETFFAH